MLLEHGADVNLPALRKGTTPVMIASRNGRADTVDLLIKNGADVNVQNTRGRTALSCAVDLNHRKVIKVLAKALGIPEPPEPKLEYDVDMDVSSDEEDKE